MQISVEGKMVEAASGVSCAEVLKQALSGKRFKAALACRVKAADTETLLDLSAAMPEDALEAAPVTADEADGLQMIRHSASHV
ncbi:MAG: threonine--tRNA ligase, partial [Mailhella sp.]|nr:threonine--tRNA ligase [Mailhella sp.]